MAPVILWSVHASSAPVKNIDPCKDDINDHSYFVTTLENGEQMVTEWNPELRLGVKTAVDTIPHVYRQAWHFIGLHSIDQVLDRILDLEQDHDLEGHPIPNFHCLKSNMAFSVSNRHLSVDMENENVLIKPIILNFTDGMETDSWPGVSVIRGLEQRHLAFTGADSILYYLDSDKALIKRHLVESGTPTPGYYSIHSQRAMELDVIQCQATATDTQSQLQEEDLPRKTIILNELSKLTFPLLVKPANSSSSRGIFSKSVVDTPEEAYERAMETRRIWGPVYAEEYITGREYTALVSGSLEVGIKVYKVLERVFRSRIPERERMLTHEMKWGDNNYGTDASVETASWWMEICSDTDQERLQPLVTAIYASFGGNGYCRMDLREDHRTGQVFVIDVNANCSIDEDVNCAMGKILQASGVTLGEFLSALMEDAIRARDNLLAQGSEHSTLQVLAHL
ncbi:hypothetical protein B0O80DRAFT_496533 [Mortierella sp. GBAus27b]|nr:hypothetical protein B0O80DRAFT_496533 [Mortierella sp. GBAus27b]